MRVLIGCERSGIVRRAFRARGHDAFSCDLVPADDGSPHHITGDVREALRERWDVAIMFPDCTYLTVSGLHWNKRGRLVDGVPRAQLTEEALEFVKEIWRLAPARKAIENPVGCLSTRWRPFTQIIQPHDFGDDASKKTCLWLDGLLPLPVDPAKRVPGRRVEWPPGSGKMVERWANQTDSGQNRLPPSADRARQRSETYPGIARARAETWG